MKKPVVLLIVFLLAAVLSVTELAGACLLSNPPVLCQSALSAKSTSLPSPLIVAAWIVGLVAVFGALLSFALRGGHTRQADAKRVGERFWAID